MIPYLASHALDAILVVSEPKSSQVIDFVSQRASLVVEVVVVPENYGSADGLRFIAHKLTVGLWFEFELRFDSRVISLFFLDLW